MYLALKPMQSVWKRLTIQRSQIIKRKSEIRTYQKERRNWKEKHKRVQVAIAKKKITKRRTTIYTMNISFGFVLFYLLKTL